MAYNELRYTSNQHTGCIFWGVDVLILYKSLPKHLITLDDQTQVDSKPAGQPEHASLNQCQLIAANRRYNWCSGHPQLVVEIWFLSNVIDARALIGPCSHVTSRWRLIWYSWHESNT